jgi:hypothetical protein
VSVDIGVGLVGVQDKNKREITISVSCISCEYRCCFNEST